MPTIRGCHFPDELLYDVERHIWYAEQPDGTVRVGLTAVAIALSGEVLGFMPRRAGRAIEAGKSVATIESGKWVGPARIGFEAVVATTNEAAMDVPSMLSADPYGEGWLVDVTPADWQAARAALLGGNAVAPAYEAWMAANGFPGCDAPVPPGTWRPE